MPLMGMPVKIAKRAPGNEREESPISWRAIQAAAGRAPCALFSTMRVRVFVSVFIGAASNPFFGSKRIVPGLMLRCAFTVMVYGSSSREPLHRLVRALGILVSRDRPIAERLNAARRIERELNVDPLRIGPVGLTETLHDNELVDRYLNVNETSYAWPISSRCSSPAFLPDVPEQIPRTNAGHGASKQIEHSPLAG